MRTTFTLAVLAGGLLAASAMPGAAACTARGQYCAYPRWASNAFAGPYARVPVGVADPDRNRDRDRWASSRQRDRRKSRDE